MTHPIIELTDLTKKYGSYAAVDKLNLQVGKGEIFGLLGPNGAGKSTTILMMLGLTEPTSGSVQVCGLNSTIRPIEVKRKVGYLPEDVGFYDDRDGIENLVYTARLNGIPLTEARKRAQDLMERVGLSEHVGKKTGKYSRGMRQRLGLADVLIKNPEVIILDEPTSGIDPSGVREFMQLIVSLSREEGITVLFSSHHLHQVQQVCDRVGIFVKGKLIAEGNTQSLSQQLYAGEPFKIRAKVVSQKKSSIPSLQEKLQALPGVIRVNTEGETLTVSCRDDITPAIARSIIEAGHDLHFLQKEEYGLDDIYNRYFEQVNHV